MNSEVAIIMPSYSLKLKFPSLGKMMGQLRQDLIRNILLVRLYF